LIEPALSQPGRVLILGASGQVGRELQRSFARAGELICCDRQQADLANPDQLRSVIHAVAPSVILNAAAYTAVDRAETDQEAATAINAHAPGILAEEARRLDALLVHYSTDYVFDGSREFPWIESDQPNPLNVYGATKLAGEQAITAVGGKHLIFRTSWVYGPHGKNFLLTMLRLGRERDQLKIVNDQTGSPTTSFALAGATRTVVDRALSGSDGPAEDWSGVYHMTCGGATTWAGFARAIFEQAVSLLGDRVPEVIPTASKDYPTPATRPLYSVLSNEKLSERFGVRLPSWRVGLQLALDRLRSV
jgi:dTDP-4-dehydrorhamnose reductase